MKRLYKYYTPESISLAGGIPMESIFPFESADINCSGGAQFSLQRGSNLSLNYQRGDGIAGLKDWIQRHTAQIHRRSDFATCMSVGSTDALAKIYSLLNGDSVIFDEYAYGTAVMACETVGRKPIGVKMDDKGMIPNELRNQVLMARSQGLNPDLIYVVPEAQNPTGVSMPYDRKQEIYKICEELDLIIVEDGEEDKNSCLGI